MQPIVSAQQAKANYGQKKEEILAVLQQAIAFYTELEETEKVQAFETMHKSLAEGTFTIVVVGEFSAGKSTLLNALMGQRLLPSFTSETTATVNFLRHTDCAMDGNAATVFYNDGRKEHLPVADFETIAHYATTKGEDVAKSIAHLDLYLESEFLKDGVTLVDSPGLNGVQEGHREITQQQILNSHASIFLFSCDHPGSKTDFEFLYDLQQRVSTIFFVLNKIDVIHAEEGETVDDIVQTLKNNYKNQFPKITSVPELWPLSASMALEGRSGKNTQGLEDSGMVAFEDRLMGFLTNGEKSRQEFLAPLQKMLDLGKETKVEFAQKKAVLEGTIDADAIQKELDQVEQVKDGLEAKQQESRQVIYEKVKVACKEVEESLLSNLVRIRDRAIRGVDQCATWEDLQNLTADFSEKFYHRAYQQVVQCDQELQENLQGIVAYQFQVDAVELTKQFAEHEMENTLLEPQSFALPDNWGDINLEAQEKKEDALKAKLATLEEACNQASKESREARKMERQLENLKEELNSVRHDKNLVESMYIPPKERHLETHRQKAEWRGGLGFVCQFIFGRKTIEVQKAIVDSTEHDEALARKIEREDAIRKQEQALLAELKAKGVVDLESAEKQVAERSAELEKARELLIQLQDAGTKKIKEAHQKAIKKWKQIAATFCDDLFDDLKLPVHKLLQEREQFYYHAVCDCVQSNLHHQLEKQQSHLERLQTQMSQAQQQREEQLACLAQRTATLDELMFATVNLKVSLEETAVDTIEQTEI